MKNSLRAVAVLALLLIVVLVTWQRNEPTTVTKGERAPMATVPVGSSSLPDSLAKARKHDAPVSLSAVTAVTAMQASKPAMPQAPALSPEKASLMAAFRAARYAVDKLDVRTKEARGANYFMQNPAQALRTWFGKDGLEVASGRSGSLPWALKLQTSWLGRGDRGEALGAASVKANGSKVELRHAGGALTEWYENRPDGLEQGFTVRDRIPGDEELRVAMTIAAGVTASLAKPGEIHFAHAEAGKVLAYSHLRSWDATGRELASRMELNGNEVALVVDDRAAQYPVTIDPTLTSLETVLGPTVTGDGAESDQFASSVAISGDTAIVGALGDDVAGATDAGSAYVFVRSAGVWTQQAKLTGAALNDLMGNAVAIDGNTAVVGAYFASPLATNSGSVRVYLRTGTTWAQQQVLTPSGGAVDDHFGKSVSVSGNTIIVGANLADNGANPDAGAAYVFTRSGVTWTQQQKLQLGVPDANGSGYDQFGDSVAVQGDNAVVGASGNLDTGAAYVFTRSGSVWSKQAVLTASDGDIGDQFGLSVALDASTAVVGAPLNNFSAGAGYVFLRSGVTWSEQAKLTGADGVSDDQLGTSVALGGDTVLLGAPREDAGVGVFTGSVYAYARSGVTWSQQSKLTAAGGQLGDQFGMTVAFDVATSSAVIGASADDTDAGVDSGSAWVFTLSGAVWTSQAQLTAGDAGGGDTFGIAVAIDGSTALAGAYKDDTAAGKDSGSAYVFTRASSVWTLQAKLVASDAASDWRFGQSLAVSADSVLVGAPGPGNSATNKGAAYVFTRSGVTWTQQSKLTSGADGAVNDQFGYGVGLYADTAVVGAIGKDFPSNKGNSGRAYAFTRTAGVWTQQATLTATDFARNAALGYSVALEGDRVVIGANGDPVGVTAGAGAAYVFTRTAGVWTQQQKLIASPRLVGETFGSSVALSGNTIVVGAPASGNGRADVFTFGGATWTLQTSLTASDGANGDYFGFSVAVGPNIAVVGAPLDTTAGGAAAGSAYVYSRTGTAWTQESKLASSVAAINDQFGTSVAMSFDGVIVGAAFDSSSAANAVGSAHTFRLSGTGISAYTTWASQGGLNAINGSLTADPDLDGLNNTLEFSFGLTPLVRNTAPSVLTGAVLTTRGRPTTLGSAPNWLASFVRRTDFATAGVTYTVLFSSDLVTWTPSVAVPTVIASDSTHQAVTVPYSFGAGDGSRGFFQVQVNVTP